MHAGLNHIHTQKMYLNTGMNLYSLKVLRTSSLVSCEVTVAYNCKRLLLSSDSGASTSKKRKRTGEFCWAKHRELPNGRGLENATGKRRAAQQGGIFLQFR